MTAETDLGLDDGRTLHVYDMGPPDAALTVFWHHGTPNTGTPPEPLFGAAAARGIRWISHDRPGYSSSEWAWLARIAGEAIEGGPEGMVEDELATTAPWGFAVDQITEPVLIVHGGQDRTVPASHGAWLAEHCRPAELWMRPDDGHVSVLVSSAVPALDWLVGQAYGR